jgi:hypothetical protein
MEAARGIRTVPGHGFIAGFRPDARDITSVAALFLLKYCALLALPPDWRMRAVFVFPILGICARTAAFLAEVPSHRPRGPFAARRRVRAGFLSGLLLFLIFLFPLRVAGTALLIGAGAAWIAWRVGNRGSARRAHRLTLQTAAVVSEATETAVLAGLVIAALLFPW